MKRTYKLLGVEWDHSGLPDKCPRFIERTDYRSWRIEWDLFDLREYVRAIPSSDLFKAKNRDEVLEILKDLTDCDKVIIVLDDIPRCPLPPVGRFYALRLLQIYEYVRKCLMGKEILISGKEDVKTICQEVLANREVERAS